MSKGTIVLLNGDLGSGKTTFVKGVLRGLNYIEEVTSPTYTLINEYNADYDIIHIDCYRESNLERWIELGMNDYMNEQNIVIVEWSDKLKSILPINTIEIEFCHKSINKREINLKK